MQQFVGTAGLRTLWSIRYTSDGSAPTIDSPVLASKLVDNPSANTPLAAPTMVVPFQGTVVDRPVRALLCFEPFGTGYAAFDTYNGFDYFSPLRMWVEDMGLDVSDTFLQNFGGFAGQPAPPVTGRKASTVTWSAVGSATYRGDGSKRTDTGDVVQGYSSYNGNGRGLWLFPAAMQSALAGATITKLEVYAYANHWWYNSGGTARIHLHGYSAAPASSPTLTYATQSTGWPKPGGRWVTIPSSFYPSFASGAYKGFAMGPAPSNGLVYYGRFAGGSVAKIRATFVK